jgi:hypothetical protein
MDLEAGARHAQLAFLVALEVANRSERPTWKPGDFFGTTFRRGQAKRAEAREKSAATR